LSTKPIFRIEVEQITGRWLTFFCEDYAGEPATPGNISYKLKGVRHELHGPEGDWEIDVPIDRIVMSRLVDPPDWWEGDEDEEG
jgi:hypothetical protein